VCSSDLCSARSSESFLCRTGASMRRKGTNLMERYGDLISWKMRNTRSKVKSCKDRRAMCEMQDCLKRRAGSKTGLARRGAGVDDGKPVTTGELKRQGGLTEMASLARLGERSGADTHPGECHIHIPAVSLTARGPPEPLPQHSPERHSEGALRDSD
jgi:hypothetical protein